MEGCSGWFLVRWRDGALVTESSCHTLVDEIEVDVM